MRWYTPIKNIDNIDASFTEAIGGLGIGSVEEFLALWVIDELRSTICNLVERDSQEIGRIIIDLENCLAPESRRLLEPIPSHLLSTFQLGALENLVSALPTFTNMNDNGQLYLTHIDKSEVNLIPFMNPIRSQGKRGTCVAFAGSALRDFFLKEEVLSPQFLYWACKEDDGLPDTEGTRLSVALKVLQNIGICRESDWSYTPELRNTPGQGPPPRGSVEKAGRFKIMEEIQYVPGAVNDIRGRLAEGEGYPVAISVPVYASWLYNPLTYRTGRIREPLPGEKPLGGHAMLVVGMDDCARVFYFRNSWGTSWGSDSPLGAGYGTISYEYIASYGWEAFSAKAKNERKIFYFEAVRPIYRDWTRPAVSVMAIILVSLLFVYHISPNYLHSKSPIVPQHVKAENSEGKKNKLPKDKEEKFHVIMDILKKANDIIEHILEE